MTASTFRARRGLFRAEEPEWLVWALVALLLAIGLILRLAVVGGTQAVTQGNVGVQVPRDWVAQPSEDPAEVVHASEPLVSSPFPATFSVRQMPVSDLTQQPDLTLGDLALKWTNRQGQDRLGYRVLSMEPATVRGNDAVKINYVYVAEPALGGPNAIPLVAEAQDVLMRRGDTLTIASFVADADAYNGLANARDRILNSLELK